MRKRENGLSSDGNRVYVAFEEWRRIDGSLSFRATVTSEEGMESDTRGVLLERTASTGERVDPTSARTSADLSLNDLREKVRAYQRRPKTKR